jgi:hypothetical protein
VWSCMRRFSASAISTLSVSSSASLPTAISARYASGASAAMAIWSPVCNRPWLRYQDTARRVGAGPPSRNASDAERSAGSCIRHTSESRWVVSLYIWCRNTIAASWVINQLQAAINLSNQITAPAKAAPPARTALPGSLVPR